MTGRHAAQQRQPIGANDLRIAPVAGREVFEKLLHPLNIERPFRRIAAGYLVEQSLSDYRGAG